jgi:hypothetical protein
MKKIESFDRATVKALRSEIEAALASVSKKYGIEISAGNATFTSSNVTFKIQAAVVAASGMVMSKSVSDFNMYSRYNGLKANLGDKFSFRGTEYTVVGWKARARKNPVLVESNGKSFRISVELINSCL